MLLHHPSGCCVHINADQDTTTQYANRDACIQPPAGGKAFVGPLYKFVIALGNSEIIVATTLVMALGTSMLTMFAGLSTAMGAFLAGLILAETDFALQVRLALAIVCSANVFASLLN